ncbi:hypothetical protein HYX70_01230 [Candidatus Saccharibacteria bacterium]|nr:hypothetical protein [Candidatus Saccharibacteria bacterium]
MAKRATRQELGDLGVVYNRLFEFVKSGKRPADEAIAGLQALVDGKFSVEGLYDRYNAQLLTIHEQMALLREYNAGYWNYALSDEDFERVFSEDDLEHAQQIDDLLLLYVDLGSPDATFETWWRVIRVDHDNTRAERMCADADHLRLNSSACNYERGIHLVHIDLLANWEPSKGRMVGNICQRSEKKSRNLAHAEVLAAYAYHPKLLQQQDGKRLPYVEMAGYELCLPDGTWVGVPRLEWNLASNRVLLETDWHGARQTRHSAPEVWSD